MYKQPLKTSIENAVSGEGLDCPGRRPGLSSELQCQRCNQPSETPAHSPSSSWHSKTTVKTLIVQGKGEIIGTVREEGKDVGVDPLPNCSENYFAKN